MAKLDDFRKTCVSIYCYRLSITDSETQLNPNINLWLIKSIFFQGIWIENTIRNHISKYLNFSNNTTDFVQEWTSMIIMFSV